MAFSVFTHIDVYETSWLAEIARVLKPSGHAFLTAHTEHTWSLLPNIHVHAVLQHNDHFNRLYPRHLELPKGRHVFESAADHHDYNCNVFQHSSYIKRQWKRWFHVLDIVPGCHAYQTGVVLQKRNLP
ncbi:hypothetical protein FEM03_00105 [Phragmitibacter flavus]|uniref:Class I SAM-dependent methyltransferase n=1 Tax=Phragmitibacter flavus TaxID=2576071 RepID=A0A5R8KJT6_9BACT|nr:hypothetical protein [Phragmitibacter flavus]TLD72517.1 hypothetical protein FEM03_00105 [Phragmitibacter flavus]